MTGIKLNISSIDKKDFMRRYGTVLGALVIFVFFSIVAKNFFTTTNLLMLLRQMSMLTIVSLGFTFVMGAGGFDMSIGNATGLVNIIFAIVLLRPEASGWLYWWRCYWDLP